MHSKHIVVVVLRLLFCNYNWLRVSKSKRICLSNRFHFNNSLRHSKFIVELLGLAGGIGVEVVVGGVAAEEVGWGVSEGSARKGWRSASAGVMRVSGSSVSMLLNKSSICLPTHKRPVSTGV